MTECLVTQKGFYSFDPSVEPSICEPGTVNFVLASQICFDCPSGTKSCLGGTNCSSKRERPDLLCVQCIENHFKTIDDNCIKCSNMTNIFESGIGLFVLFITVFVVWRLLPSDDGFFFSLCALDYAQLFLLTMMLGLGLGNGSVGILTIMSR